MNAFHGTDPGRQSGAFTALGPDGRTVNDWAAYTLIKHRTTKVERWRVRFWSCSWKDVQSKDFTTYSALCAFLGGYSGRSLSHWHRDGALLVVEDIFVPTWALTSKRRNRDGSPRRMSMQDSVTLAESAGALIAHLEPASERNVRRVMARTWRPEVAGIPARTEAKRAGELAVKYAKVIFDWSACPPSGLTKVELEALSESAFIGRWGWAKRRILLAPTA